jgi:hypothetical protein
MPHFTSGSHGRNTRSSTLVAEPVQTLESVEAANKALDDRLRQIGLRVVNVASDGECDGYFMLPQR